MAADVGAWCLESGANPLLRIVVCGSSTLYDALLAHGWTKTAWKANGGFGSQGQGRGRANAARDMLWCSPPCVPIPTP